MPTTTTSSRKGGGVEVVLWRGPGGKLFPYYIRRGSGDEEDFIDFAPDGSPSRIDAGGQHRLVLFCEEWLTGAS